MNEPCPDFLLPTPQASFLGLPTELRLHIYSYLNVQTHEYTPWAHRPAPKKHRCRTPDPNWPQLCNRPEFSGTYAANELCINIENFVLQHPIRWTCRKIYQETQNMAEQPSFDTTSFLTVPMITFTNQLQYPPAHYHDYPVGKIVDLTFACDGTYECYNHFLVHFGRIAPWMSSLRSVAIQRPLPAYKFQVKRPHKWQARSFQPEKTWRDRPIISHLGSMFEGRVTVILDAWVLVRSGQYENSSSVDKMARVRGIVWGSKDERGKAGDAECHVSWHEVVREDKDWVKTWTTKGGYEEKR